MKLTIIIFKMIKRLYKFQYQNIILPIKRIELNNIFNMNMDGID